MRVLQLVTAFQYRGAEIAALQFSRELVTHGHIVLYASLYSSTDDFVIYPGIESKCLNGRKHPLLDTSLLKALAQLIKDFRPDIVQANAGDTLKYAAIASFLQSKHYKLVFRNASTVSRYMRSSAQRLFNRFLYSRVDKILSVSQESKRDLLAVFPQLTDRVKVVPNGINIATVTRPTPHGSVVSLVHVGGFSFEKNHLGLIRIFQRVLVEVPEAKLNLVGQGSLMSQIREKVSEQGLKDSVHFHGATKEALKFIAAADVLVLPSVIEGLPGVVLEAFLCMTPVVAYDVGGISEVLINNETGWLIKPGDEIGFSNAIVEAIKSNDQRKLIAARRLVVDKYDVAKLAVQVIDEYNFLNR
ncbi:glycosyltransferase [Chryseolinea sp. T2]|uniref:glycosyltransferase n=1 Tax=Chryseolinea sp. T2 TaxID=3129255 RepID=UPI003076C36F